MEKVIWNKVWILNADKTWKQAWKAIYNDQKFYFNTSNEAEAWWMSLK